MFYSFIAAIILCCVFNTVPCEASVPEKAEYISAGAFTSAAITENGSLYVWGYNIFGQVGDGTTENRNTATKALDNVSQVSLGCFHSVALDKDGHVWTWGSNSKGALGDETFTTCHEPKMIMEDLKFKAVYANDGTSGALCENGDFYMWGLNDYGQVGDGTTENCSKPFVVMHDVKTAAVGEYVTGAVTTDGKLYMWGRNNCGQLGDDTREEKHTPVYIMDNVKAISIGTEHSAAIKTDGSLWTWGTNFDFRLGEPSIPGQQLTPIKIMDNVVQVVANASNTAAITEDGSLYMWGDNSSGQIPTDINVVTKPAKVMDQVKMIGLGVKHSIIMKADNSIVLYGANDYGQLGTAEDDPGNQNSDDPGNQNGDDPGNQTGDDPGNNTGDQNDEKQQEETVTKYTIAKARLSNTTFSYTGKAVAPVPIVKYGSKTLKINRDYSVKYSNNVKVGTAVIVIRGKGMYTGKLTKTFKIIPEKAKITYKKTTAVYEGTQIIVKVSSKSAPKYYELALYKDKKCKKVLGKTKFYKKDLIKGKIYAYKHLKKGKAFYVRVRAAKSKSFIGAWSKAVKIKGRG